MKKILNRVPEVAASFWIIKILATTVGETAADYLSVNLNLDLSNTSYVMSGILLIALLIQFRLKRYVPISYWIVVVLMSITGTLITDRLIDDFGISLMTTNIAFSIVLIVIFGLWYVNEKTLAMHSINTAKREIFYWTAILFTFALGTSTGDFLAEATGLGYAHAALMFGVLIAAITFGYFYCKVNAILSFWLAYILTRPLGASIGDLLSQPMSKGGLGFGTVGTSMLFLAIIVGLVTYAGLQKKNQQDSMALDHEN
ncbi:MAG: hypothetical protein NW214_14030 [Pseudanabaenaceae cyanobacterium bins.39]|nr:hypothetical protein [Pseudanabaenaceae cyanobacterium bins.39]